MSGERVAVAMSGGVDSSVAAALLLEEGCSVVGVTIRMWSVPATETESQLASRAEQDARAVASKLGIPHFVMDLRDDFAACVVKDFVDEYRLGRTPNPCVRCNPRIKFGAFLRQAAEQHGVQRIATGHYARIEWDEDTRRFRLLRGIDRAKDQSYVLYRLDQEQLSRTLMPAGRFTKEQIRGKAAALDLGLGDKDESQDICFIPGGRYQDFLARSVPELLKPGPIVDESGNVVGRHQGVAFYTVGQRRGLRVASGRRLYVTAIDARSNTVVVGPPESLTRRSVMLKDMALVSGGKLTESVVVSAKIRYNTQDSRAVLRPLRDDWAELVFDEDQRAATPGQSAVCYRGEEVLGGGVIADRVEADRMLSRD